MSLSLIYKARWKFKHSATQKYFFKNLYQIKYLAVFFSPSNSPGSFPPSAVLSLPGSSSLTDVHDESRQKVTE